jgi:xylose isomerase
MQIKYSVITGFLGRLRDRFTEYQTKRTLEEKLELASRIKGLQGVELIYPSDFSDFGKLKRLIDQYGLGVSAVNVNLKAEPRWTYGSLTSTSEKTRREAEEVLKQAMDRAYQLDCNLITVCLLNDGHDYPFQVNYQEAWKNLIEAIKRVADYRSDIKVSLEYKMSEPVVRTIVGTVGKGLHFCHEVDRKNVGITLDVGHALQAGENPTESLSLLVSKGKLFYLHINDNFRNWDWDLIPGFVNFWDYLELLFYLREYDYQGWIAMDVSPKNLNPVEVFTTSIEFMRNIEHLLKNIDSSHLFQLMKGRNTPKIFSYLQNKTLNLS